MAEVICHFRTDALSEKGRRKKDVSKDEAVSEKAYKRSDHSRKISAATSLPAGGSCISRDAAFTKQRDQDQSRNISELEKWCNEGMGEQS